MLKWVCILTGMVVFPAFFACATTGDLVISEILPNPIGDETQNEFIEIYNSGATEIDLGGLFLDDADGGSTPFAIPAGTKISAGGYLTFYSKDTGLGLTNTGERARILNADKSVLTEVIYGNAAENYSYLRKPDGTYAWVTPPAPENVFVIPSPTPTPEPALSPTASPTAAPSMSPSPTPDYSAAKNLVVNELLPDPSGNDGENEFIEIYNPGSGVVDLSGFYVDDAEGGSTPHKITDGTVIEAGGYLVFYSRDTKITLNNTSSDSARLLYPDKTVLSSISYDKSSHEDYSYARKSDGSFAWTSEPTPGEENEFVLPTEEPLPTSTPKATLTPKPSATPKPTKKPKATATPKGSIVAADSTTTRNYTYRKPGGIVLGAAQVGKIVELAKIGKEKIGELVTVKGIVSQTPGTFDTRLMYLAGSGVGVFLSGGDFLGLALGDTVSVTGVLVKPGKELFVTVGAKENIVREGSGAAPEPHNFSLKEIDDEKIGWLVKTEGDVLKNSANQFEISSDEKTIKIITNESVGDYKVGEKVSVIGIVSADSGGLRILATKVEAIKTEQQKKQNKILLLIMEHWKAIGSALCFSMALMLALIFYYPQLVQKAKPLFVSP